MKIEHHEKKKYFYYFLILTYKKKYSVEKVDKSKLNKKRITNVF